MTEHPRPDRFAAARALADAVLYEGYVLYPYRATSPKNQVRFQWGVLMPADVVARDSSERDSLRTGVVVEGRARELTVQVRFLHVQRRAVQRATGDGFADAERLDTATAAHVPWDEAVEREATITVPLAARRSTRLDHRVPEQTVDVPGGEEHRGRPARRAASWAGWCAPGSRYGSESKVTVDASALAVRRGAGGRAGAQPDPGHPDPRGHPAGLAASGPRRRAPAARDRRRALRLPARSAGVGEGLRRGVHERGRLPGAGEPRRGRHGDAVARRSSCTTTRMWRRRAPRPSSTRSRSTSCSACAR